MIVTLPLDRATRSAVALVGGKAASLGELLQAGHRVPDGFVVTTPAFHRHIEAVGIGALLQGETPSPLLLSRARETAVDADAANQILAAYRALVGDDPTVKVAVRSSAVDEDGVSRSFAGQHSTYYHVGPQELLPRIVDCWLSCWSDHARAYRERTSSPGPSMAVIVQLMVPADVSGVVFSHDPAGRDPELIVIESCWGLGAALVDGRVSPDRFRVARRDLEIVERHVADKQYRVGEEQASHRLELVPRSLRRRSTLSDQDCARVAQLALDCERVFGAGQDVEWAIADGELCVLQSRPITVPPTRGDVHIDGEWVIFKPVFENFTGPLTPLSVDLLGRAVPPLGRFFDGRPYVSFGLIRAVVPIEASDSALVDLALLRTPTEPIRFAWRKLARSLLLGLFVQLTFGVLMVRTRYLDVRMLEQTRAKCARLLADDRVDVLRTLHTLTLPGPPGARIGELPFAANLASARYFIYQAVLRAYAARYLPDLDEEAISVLCAPGKDVASMRLLADLDAIAEAARAEPRVARLIASSADRDVLLRVAALPEGAAFVAALERFVATYGHRGVREIELGAPRWAEDPSSLLTLVRARIVRTAVAAPRINAHSKLDKTRVGNPIHRTIVNSLGALARRFGALRENTRQYHVLALTTVRMKILALERELLRRGLLKCPGDVFYLTWDEVRALDREELSWTDVDGRIRDRRLEHRKREARRPPLTFNVARSRIDPATDPEGTTRLNGLCASTGEVVGIARIVLDPANAELSPGDILVAPYTDPSWTPLFPLVLAVVVETGSYLSHAGTVARELGVPCIVDVEGCTQRIRNGQRLHVHAEEGFVRVLPDERAA